LGSLCSATACFRMFSYGLCGDLSESGSGVVQISSMKAQRGCAGQIFEARDSRLYTNSYVVDGKMTKQRKTRTFEIQRRNLDLPHQFPKQKT
jgi:hypothetical protein